MTLHAPHSEPLSDRFGRHITYLRLSVTDRCDFRCTYCMAEEMTFLPRSEVLSLEELATVAEAFVELGVTNIRLTGGEPLIRKNITSLVHAVSGLSGLEELNLTTNASQLADMAKGLKDAGLTRINISLDSLQPERFKQLTRHGELSRVMEGIEAARAAGFERIKINCVVLKHFNFDEVSALTHFALERVMDISFIEEMPLGEIHAHARDAEFISSSDLRAALQQDFHLTPHAHTSGGPSRYWQAEGYKSLVGFISPHSDNFCGDCNRVRVTASGRLLLCLGNEHSVDLRSVLRSTPASEQKTALKQTIVEAMNIKPERHEFDNDDAPQLVRFMNATGG